MHLEKDVMSRAGIVARKMCSSTTSVDSMGNDVDDYASMLAYSAMSETSSKASGLPEGERRALCYCVIRRRSIDHHRKRGAADRVKSELRTMSTTYSLKDEYNMEASGTEDYYASIDMIKKIRSAMSDREWTMLSDYVEHGTLRSSHKHNPLGVSLSKYRNEYIATIEKCKEVLGGK